MPLQELVRGPSESHRKGFQTILNVVDQQRDGLQGPLGAAHSGVRLGVRFQPLDATAAHVRLELGRVLACEILNQGRRSIAPLQDLGLRDGK
eukprot:1507014-Rhodomonas_salina.1